jgi:nucleotide-binding universal stress UspA family protein
MFCLVQRSWEDEGRRGGRMVLDVARPVERAERRKADKGAALAQRLIVVGVDGSEASREALRWAVDEARLRSAAVRVVHAWWAYPMVGADDAPGQAAEGLGGDARAAVEAFVGDTLGGGLDVALEIETVQGRQASAAVLDAAEEAELLVVGSRGTGGFGGLLLGSVSQQVVHHASCPVVVVRGRESGAEQS